jgi:hypothetical protein
VSRLGCQDIGFNRETDVFVCYNIFIKVRKVRNESEKRGLGNPKNIVDRAFSFMDSISEELSVMSRRNFHSSRRNLQNQVEGPMNNHPINELQFACRTVL